MPTDRLTRGRKVARDGERERERERETVHWLAATTRPEENVFWIRQVAFFFSFF
jgi:hypothetical protein